MPVITLPRTTIGPAVLIPELLVGDRDVPRDLAGFRVERHDVRVARRAEHLVAEDRDIPLRAPPSPAAAPRWPGGAADIPRSARPWRRRAPGRHLSDSVLMTPLDTSGVASFAPSVIAHDHASVSPLTVLVLTSARGL